jgi:hypothetical protein
VPARGLAAEDCQCCACQSWVDCRGAVDDTVSGDIKVAKAPDPARRIANACSVVARTHPNSPLVLERSARREQPWLSAGHAFAEFLGGVLSVGECCRAVTLIVMALAEFYVRPRHAERVNCSGVESDPVIPVEFLWGVPSQMKCLSPVG